MEVSSFLCPRRPGQTDDRELRVDKLNCPRTNSKGEDRMDAVFSLCIGVGDPSDAP